MSKVIGLLIIAAVGLLGYVLYNYYQTMEEDKKSKKPVETEINVWELGQMPRGFEESLKQAESLGTKAFGDWVKTHGPHVPEPRRSWIELDYVVMIATEKPAEAKKL